MWERADLSPHFSPHYAPTAHGRQRMRAESRRHNKLGFLGSLGTLAEAPGTKNGGQGWIRTSVRETRADLQSYTTQGFSSIIYSVLHLCST